MFHDFRECLGTSNDLMLVGGSEIGGNKFGACRSGLSWTSFHRSYPCVVRRVPLYWIPVGPRIITRMGPSWAC